MLPSLQRINGSENVNSMNAITGAEDFSFFQEKIPGIYFFIGGAKKGTDPLKAAPHHTPDFYVDDSAMITGLRSMTTRLRLFKKQQIGLKISYYKQLNFVILLN